MKCDEFLSNIDAYIDGELSAEALDEMLAHAANCDACRAEMKTAELLRDALKDFDNDLTVPLEAQAAWRKAVRAESRKKNLRGRMRGICTVAAAIVVVLGCTFALNGDIFADKRVSQENTVSPRAYISQDANEDLMMIAADGEVERNAAQAENYSAVKKYAVDDIEAAGELLRNLAVEYEASFAEQYAMGEDVYYCVELPMDYQEDFLSAMNILGDELDAEIFETNAENALVRINLIAK